MPTMNRVGFHQAAVTHYKVPRVTGLFEAAEMLCQAGRISPEGIAAIETARSWIGRNLPRPELVLSPDALGVRARVFYKCSAKQLGEHIRRVGEAVMEDSNFRGGPQVAVGSYARHLTGIEYEDDYVVLLSEV